jgi:hypothetical protein
MMTTSTEPVPEVIEQKSKRRWNAERWISEFVVIVAGVLVALSANSLWEGWHESRTERVYIEQLRIDMDENVRRLQAAIALEIQQQKAATAAFQAVTSGQPISRDSAQAWLITRRGVYYSDPRLLTGTVTELISTGNLRLLRNAALRQAVAGYATRIREDRDEFDRFVASLQPPFEVLRNEGFRNNPPGFPREDFGAVVAAVTGTPGKEVLAALDGVLIASEIRSFYLRSMLQTSEQLRKLL